MQGREAGKVVVVRRDSPVCVAGEAAALEDRRDVAEADLRELAVRVEGAK